MEPVVYRIRVPLEKKDEEFAHIQNLIEAKRNLLLHKQKKLKNISKQNHFLEEIQNDYSKYYGYITEQKQNQIKALELLQNYINDLTKSGELTKYNITDAKEEQRKILKEIKTIKYGLDSIISDTNNITSSIQEKII